MTHVRVWGAFHLNFLLPLSLAKTDVASYSLAVACFGFRWGKEMNWWEIIQKEWNIESPEGQDDHPDTFWRAEAIVSQTQSWSGVMAYSRFLSSFHPHPHLLLLPLIGSDWIWPSDAKHAQRPARGLMAETCKAQTDAVTKDIPSSRNIIVLLP